jgi:hypothetical protein
MVLTVSIMPNLPLVTKLNAEPEHVRKRTPNEQINAGSPLGFQHAGWLFRHDATRLGPTN